MYCTSSISKLPHCCEDPKPAIEGTAEFFREDFSRHCQSALTESSLPRWFSDFATHFLRFPARCSTAEAERSGEITSKVNNLRKVSPMASGSSRVVEFRGTESARFGQELSCITRSKWIPTIARKSNVTLHCRATHDSTPSWSRGLFSGSMFSNPISVSICSLCGANWETRNPGMKRENAVRRHAI